VSRPDQHLARSHGVEATFFLVNVTSGYLAEIAGLLDGRKLRSVWVQFYVVEAREVHFMLEDIRSHLNGKIVLAVGAS
jgi:hypothetical protein